MVSLFGFHYKTLESINHGRGTLCFSAAFRRHLSESVSSVLNKIQSWQDYEDVEAVTTANGTQWASPTEKISQDFFTLLSNPLA
jgi:hypothetical protein